MDVTFYLLSTFTILSALAVIFIRNQLYSILCLILCFFGIAGHFFLLHSSFLGIVQIIVYAGAIMVLFLFVIMLINFNKQDLSKHNVFPKVIGGASACLFMAILGFGLWQLPNYSHPPKLLPIQGQTKTLGRILFQDFSVPFEISSILFLSATIGVVLISQKGNKK